MGNSIHTSTMTAPFVSGYNKVLDLYDQHGTVAGSALRIVRFGGNGLRLVVSKIKDVDVLGFLRLANFLDIPSNLRDTYRAGAKFFKDRKVALTVNEKIDHATSFIGKIGEILDNTTTGIMGLGAVGAISLASLPWLVPVFTAGIALEGVFVIQSGKVACEAYQLLKKVKALTSKRSVEFVTQFSGKPCHKLASMVSLLVESRKHENSFISKHFRVKGSEFTAKLQNISTKAVALGDNANSISQIINKTIRRYLQTKIVQHVISGVALSVMLIGLTVMLTVPPATAVAFAILFVGCSISLANRYYVKHTQQAFEAKMNEAHRLLTDQYDLQLKKKRFGFI